MKELTLEEYYDLISKLHSYEIATTILGILVGALIGGLIVYILGRLYFDILNEEIH